MHVATVYEACCAWVVNRWSCAGALGSPAPQGPGCSAACLLTTSPLQVQPRCLPALYCTAMYLKHGLLLLALASVYQRVTAWAGSCRFHAQHKH